MPEWMFSKMMRSAQIRFTDHSILRVIQLLGKLGNWRRVLQVIEWLQMRERSKSYKLIYIYTTALDVLGRARRPVEALNVFHAMLEQMSSYPDLLAYHSIVVTLGQARHMRELFDQLKQKGLPPATTTYGLVMEVMLACGKYNLVHEFFKKVQKSSIPNALTSRVIVNTLWREGKIDEAVSVVHNMEIRGIVPRSTNQIENICKVANKPLIVTYTGLIQVCLDARSVENVAYVFKQMENVCSPNLVTYNIMLKPYLDHGMFEKAKDLFLRMLDDGNNITSRSCKFYIEQTLVYCVKLFWNNKETNISYVEWLIRNCIIRIIASSNLNRTMMMSRFYIIYFTLILVYFG
ncbi:hypothetical protein TB2_013200 [Malus domestica]